MESNSSLPFFVKYRPTSFSNYIGGGIIEKEVLELFSDDTVKTKFIMIEGDKGKTTLSRLIASKFLCECNDTSTCGVCSIFIKEGIEPIFIKSIDLASDITKFRLFLSEMSSFVNHKRVFIIDDLFLATLRHVHALLDAIEDMKNNTSLGETLVIVVSNNFNFDRITADFETLCDLKLTTLNPSRADLVNLLRDICIEEGIDYGLDGLAHLSDMCNLDFRKSLCYLQSISQSYDCVNIVNVGGCFE